MAKRLTDEEKAANKAERDRIKSEKLAAEEATKNDSNDSPNDGDVGEGETNGSTPPKVVDQASAQKGVQFCSQFEKYCCRGVQFDNYRVRVTDEDIINQLKADPKFGVQFWVCPDQAVA